MSDNFFLYLLVMAGVTYLVRMLPMVFLKRPIRNRFLLAFLKYIPTTVLAVMTVPAVFYATSPIPSIVGFAVAVILSFFDRNLITVALGASFGTLAAELAITWLL